jgi:hypothetical protein
MSKRNKTTLVFRVWVIKTDNNLLGINTIFYYIYMYSGTSDK